MPPNPSTSSHADRDIASFTIHSHILRRIERLAHKFLSMRFDGPEGLWKLQLDLLALQREIQSEINTAKSQIRNDSNIATELRNLRTARWHSKRLGDAFAWTLLGLDRKTICPLSENERVSISQEDHGSRGMIAITQHLASSGWGFPVIHDITDCLRIGDVTFKRIVDTGPIYRTVEIKTHLETELYGEDEARQFKYAVQVISPEPFDPENGATISLLPPSNTPASTGATILRPDRRIDRQVRRMSKALAHQTATDYAITEMGDEPPLISVLSNIEAPSHSKEIRRIIRDARKHGYASECIDGALLYIALYDSAGVTDATIKDPRMLDDLSASGIMASDNPRENALIVNSIPPQEQRNAHLFLPWYLYSIPQRAIYDLLYNRLSIIIIASQGKVADALRKAGFEIVSRPNRAFNVSAFIESSAGNKYKIAVPNIPEHFNQMIYEFYGVDFLVGMAKAVSTAVSEIIIPDTEGR